MTDRGLPARRAALEAMRAVDEDGTWSNMAVDAAIDALPDARDRSFAAHLAYEALRWQGTLDAVLSASVSRSLGDVEPALLRVLRLGAVQLLVSDTPARAAVDTSVTLAREQVPRSRAKSAGGFVNGVLRNVVRRGADQWPSESVDPVRHLALTTGHPGWIVEDLLARHDVARVRAILEADNASPGVTLRAVAPREQVLAALAEEGVDAVGGAAPEAIRAPGMDPGRSAVVRDGFAVVQDEASMRVVHATGVTTGDRVLDLCAGPGGKTTHLASLVGSTGSVTAVEKHPHRARLISQAARRTGVEVDVRVGDAAEPPLGDDEPYDVVLLDAPCTGLGTGRRRPEVRWRRTPGDVTALARVQRDLLVAAAGRTAPGGTLTYAVCTWTARETDAVADAFETSTAGGGFTASTRVQLFGDTDDTDGMFIASWIRQADVASGR